MKRYLIFPMIILFSSGLFSQGIYNNGAKIVVGSGTCLYINGNLQNETNVNNGSIDLSGTLKIAGNYTNNVVGSDILANTTNGSLVELNGTTNQTIGGTTSAIFVFPKLKINKISNDITLLKSIEINDSIIFNNGLVDIGNNNLTFRSLAGVGGNPSASSLIIATGNGQVLKNWSATGSSTFPVGDKNIIGEYSPVTLNFTSGTFSPGSIVGINLVNTKYNDPTIINSYLNRYWNITQTGITAFSCNAVFQYLPSDIIGTESSISCLQVSPLPFIAYDPANTTLHQLTASGLTSFGTFTGGIGTVGKTLNLTAVLLQGLYNGGGTLRQAWDATGPHWPAGIADHITVELHDAVSYGTIVYTATDVPLNTNGTASVNVPAIYNGSYYITIKNRNSLQTVSATTKSFAGSTIAQSFGSPADVFGGNLIQMVDLGYAIYGGDVNQDNIIDLFDSSPVDNAAAIASSGYVPEDVNGDGLVDLLDASIIDNNAAMAIGAATP